MRLRYRNSLTIIKTSGYYDQSGSWVSSEGANTPIQCNIQPLRQRKDRENLPEGKTSRQSWVVYVPLSEATIDVSDPVKGVSGDEADIDGFRCEAVYSEKWRNGRLAHYKVLFTRKEVEGNS